MSSQPITSVTDAQAARARFSFTTAEGYVEFMIAEHPHRIHVLLRRRTTILRACALVRRDVVGAWIRALPLPRMPGLVAALGLALVSAGSLEAQRVTGQVTEAGTGEPVSAALVELLDPGSMQVGAVLTDPEGRYTVRAGAPGRYTVRVRRLGFATTSLAPIAVTGTHRLDVQLETRAVRLEGVVATARAVCADGPGVGADTEQLWDLVVDALDVARLAQSLDSYRFEMLLYARDRTLDGRHVLADAAQRAYESGAFVAMPLETLEDQGYVEPHRGGLLSWFMPDPAVLVSDHFLGTHCFRVVDSDDPGLVGLGFDPTPQRMAERPDARNDQYEELFGEGVVEVRGVLWVERATGALSHMEYDYAGVRDDDVDAVAGGSARFEQLSGGLFIVRQWLMRMPNLRVEDGRLVAESRRESGGYVVQAFDDAVDGARSPADPDGPPTALPARASGGDLVGRLVVSDVPISLSDAVVRLSGSSRAVATDSVGRFVFTGVPPGDYVVTWSSPELEQLGLPPRGVDVSIEGGAEQTTVLPGPTWDFATAHLCPGTQMDPGFGIVRVHGKGSLLGRAEGMPLQLRRINIWSTEPSVPFARSAVPRSGIATFCGVPIGVPLEAQVGDSLSPMPIEPAPDRIRAIGR